MFNLFRREASDAAEPGGTSASPKIFERILHWLFAFFQLTEQEEEDAGIYFRE